MKLTPLVFDVLAASELNAADWQIAWPGVERHVLYDTQVGTSAALLRYAPGAHSPRHRHPGYEHIYVVSGSQRDERGHYKAGTLIVNEPGTEHRVISDEGCVVLLIWQQPIVVVGD
jgi:anti-sigma factor ChrR (cupin superfamily)